MDILKKNESKLLDRLELEALLPGKAGTVSRAEAIALVAGELKVEKDRIGLVALEPRAGSRDLIGKFRIFNSAESLKKLQPEHLVVRLLSKEEREKLKQAKKKLATPPPAPEAKK